jgi:hypothetical protein
MAISGGRFDHTSECAPIQTRAHVGLAAAEKAIFQRSSAVKGGSMEHNVDVVIQSRARTTGFVYLAYFVTAFLGAYLMNGLVASTDGAATANNLLTHESRYLAGVAVNFGSNLVYMVLIVLFYRLFAPVSRSLALLALVFGLVGCGVQIFAAVFQWAPLILLGDGPWSTAFNPEQLHALAMLSLKLYNQTFSLSFVLFAGFDIALGTLIYRSSFLPRWLGAWLALAGVGALGFLWPPLAPVLSKFVLSLAGVPELVIMAWLITKGIDTAKWQSLARGTRGA